MAIEKDIAIHHTHGIENVITYTKDPEKSNIFLNRRAKENGMDIEQLILQGEEQDIVNALSYAENLEKTILQLDDDEQLLTSGVLCKKDHAASEFQMVRAAYYRATSHSGNRIKGTKKDKKTGQTVQKESIEAYHVIQSFPEIEGLDPRLVHKIGIEYAKAAFPGHQCVVSTHMNTVHLHNHIIVNAYSAENIGRKYKMDMARRREIRRINDEFSLKYGLPILMDNDLRHNKGMTWHEWKARKDGNSWKEQLRNDIRSARDKASSWEEFKQLMQQSGYKIRETKSTVTYTMPDSDTRKCRDSRLEDEYRKEALCNYWKTRAQEATKEAPGTVKYKWENRTNEHHIHISRYTDSGRRRSELEMLILMAIHIIQYFKDRFLDLINGRDNSNVANRPYTDKLALMNKALSMLENSSIRTKNELETRMNKAGAELSRIRKVLKEKEPLQDYEGEIAEKIKSFCELEEKLRDRTIEPDHLFLHSYTDKEVSSNTAILQPTTPAIRRELYRKVNEKGLFLKYGFNDIPLSAAKAVIDYANGQITVMPSCLMTREEARQIALRRQLEPNNPVQPKESSNSASRNEECDRRIDLLTRYYSEEDKELLYSYRSLLNDLAALGITPDQISALSGQLEASKQETIRLQKQMVELKDEYKELSKIKWYIELAEDDSFLRGSLFRRTEPGPEQKTAQDVSKKPVEPSQEPEKKQHGNMDTEEEISRR